MGGTGAGTVVGEGGGGGGGYRQNTSEMCLMKSLSSNSENVSLTNTFFSLPVREDTTWSETSRSLMYSWVQNRRGGRNKRGLGKLPEK